MAESIESRLARLERELAFLKAQGLSKEEQNSLMARPQRAHYRKSSRWLVVLVILNVVLLASMGILSFVYFSDKGKETKTLPKRSDSFALPGTDPSR